MSKIPEIKTDKGDVIGVGVDGSGNIIGKNISVVINQARGYGLTLLNPNHFKENSDTEQNFEDWKNGFSLNLESIYYKREYRRETVLEDLENKLESQNRLLLLGESGYSKTTLLMEIICHYFDKGYKVLYSEGNEEPKEPDNISEFIKDLVREGNKVLVAIDNVHDKKMASIFHIINLLQSFNEREDVIFLLSARQPEYNSLLDKGKFTLADDYRHAMESLFVNAPNYNYEIKPFSENEIIEFVTKYKEHLPKNLKQISIEENAKVIFDDTGGHPIMVKFSVIGEGLQRDVEDRYGRYLLIDRDREKPDSNRIRTVMMCSLFHISTLQITDELLDKIGLLQYANDLDRAVLHYSADGTWTTIHTRWDLELLSYLFGFSNKNLIKIMKDDFSYAVQLTFANFDEDTILTIVNTLYATIVINKFVSIDIINSILPVIPNSFSDDLKVQLYTLVIGITHDDMGKHEKAIEWYDKALDIDPNDVNALSNKGVALRNLKRFEEAVEWYDKALDIDPNDVDDLYNKGLALDNLGKHQEAIEWYDKALKIDPDDGDTLNNKGLALSNLGKDQEAIEWYDKALDIDPNDVNALNNKGVALRNLKRFEEAVEWYDKALEINPNDVGYLSNKSLALDNLGKYDEAIDCYEEALRIDPKYVIAWDIKGFALSELNRLDEALQCSAEAIQLDPSYANAWYNRSCQMAKKGDANETLKNLAEAIKLDETNIESAKTDKDFDSIRDNAKFKELVGLS